MTLSEIRPPEKWYFKTPMVITAFLTIGPFALPLVLLHPRYPLWVKLLVTCGTIVLTYYLIQWSDRTMKAYSAYYDQLFKLMQQLKS
ncbi:MAG: hypothetical protein KBC91_04275 [Candidatus Omnitrophica bacterium]|nr:hypothetical protein [Candidatus Omnitrophota bacterium]